MPWIEGGLPVTIDTLLGQVKLGMTHWAIALNPVSMKRATLGTIPSLSARSKYAGSPPSLQTTTTGRSGQQYRTPLRRISGPGADVIRGPRVFVLMKAASIRSSQSDKVAVGPLRVAPFRGSRLCTPGWGAVSC